MSALALLACRSERRTQKGQDKPSLSSPSTPINVGPRDYCQRLVDQLKGQDQAETTPKLNEFRAEILGRARSVPVLFTRRPEAPPVASARVVAFREQLIQAQDPAEAISKVLRKTRRNHVERRQIFLSEGYLYAESPLLALRLSQIIRLDHLFNEPSLVIERGDEILRLRRVDGRYLQIPDEPSKDPDAPEGVVASLLLFDRVTVAGASPREPLHLDLRSLRDALGFSRAEIVAHTADRLALRLATRGIGSLVVLGIGSTEQDPQTDQQQQVGAGLLRHAVENGAVGSGLTHNREPHDQQSDEPGPAIERGRLTLICESSLVPEVGALQQAREAVLSRERLVAPILAAAHEMISRRLPFDEPRTEEGQQDGLLRLHFRKAYRQYEYTYEFNGDTYYVFDGRGHVRLPQVCIDFITDAFDWGTGGEWPNRGEKRRRKKGALDFGSFDIENARSVESVLEFALATPEWFDTVWFEKSRRVKFRYREKFFEALARNADLFWRGDVVFIYGLRDDGKYHFHSFFIDEKDPLTGIPTLVLANAGPPQARTIEGEMQNAPDRAIVARMRLRSEVLQRAATHAREHPGEPLVPPAPRELQEGTPAPRSRQEQAGHEPPAPTEEDQARSAPPG